MQDFHICNYTECLKALIYRSNSYILTVALKKCILNDFLEKLEGFVHTSCVSLVIAQELEQYLFFGNRNSKVLKYLFFVFLLEVLGVLAQFHPAVSECNLLLSELWK